MLRIGISFGDVVVDGDDLLGDGVNIATRLEGLAEPGGICIADAVQKQLGGKTDFAFNDLGEHTLKNITQPVRVWGWAKEPAQAVGGPSLPLPDKPSIAVLPFDNLSGQPEETYFSDGITEDIITGLARFRSLFVIARNSSFAFRGKAMDMAEIGRRLGVSYLLEGSVRRAGERVRITAQLIEAGTGSHLWAERYDRSLDDIFAVQDEVAQTIVSTLVGRIEDARLRQVLRRPTDSLAAYDCLLRGIAHFWGDTEAANQQALEMFKKAVDLDPGYALARSYRAIVKVALSGHASATTEVLHAAFTEANHALELDPLESRCHRILSTICLYRREYDLAERHVRRAFDLNPNDTDIVTMKGRVLVARGRPEEALACFETAVRLNPIHPHWYRYSLWHRPVFASALSQKRRKLSPRCPDRTRGQVRGSQLATLSLNGRKRHRRRSAEVLRLKPDFSTGEFMSKASCLNMPKIGSISVKGSSRPGCQVRVHYEIADQRALRASTSSSHLRTE